MREVRTIPLRYLGLLLLFPLFQQAVGVSSAEGNADVLTGQDQATRVQALERVLAESVGAQESWSNIDSGHSGTFTAGSMKRNAAGLTCRDVTENLTSDSATASGIVTACQAGGSSGWVITRSEMTPFTTVPADIDGGTHNPAAMPQVQLWIDPNTQRMQRRYSSGGDTTKTTQGAQ